MNLRTRLSIVALIALTIFVTMFYALAGVTIDRTYARLDSQNVERQVLRARSYLTYSLETLGRTCSDWAYWDDTYQFVLDHNTAYADSNLTPSSLATIDVSTMVFLDTSGKVVYVSSAETGSQTPDDAPSDLIAQFEPGTALLAQALRQPGLTGYMLVGGHVAFVAARPILTSASPGPVRGVLVFVRDLDDASFASMAETVGGSVTLQPVSYTHLRAHETRHDLVCRLL